MKVALVISLLALFPADARAKDMYLFSGQSNMEGWTTMGSHVNDQWGLVRPILIEGNSTGTMYQDLYDAIYTTNNNREAGTAPPVVADKEATELINFHSAGRLDNLDTSLTLGKCSFLLVNKDNGEMFDVTGGDGTANSDVRATTVPTAWDANCGKAFSHEFTFSKALEEGGGQSEEFEVVKVASGGTEIHKHWYPGFGMHWDVLSETISTKASEGTWKGFVWHQGSQGRPQYHAQSIEDLCEKDLTPPILCAWQFHLTENWVDEEFSLNYKGNLTRLVDQIRTEMYLATPGDWNCKLEIPVVVVQVGAW